MLICLHYKYEERLERKVPIPASRASEVEEGQKLTQRIKRNAEKPIELGVRAMTKRRGNVRGID